LFVSTLRIRLKEDFQEELKRENSVIQFEICRRYNLSTCNIVSMISAATLQECGGNGARTGFPSRHNGNPVSRHYQNHPARYNMNRCVVRGPN